MTDSSPIEFSTLSADVKLRLLGKLTAIDDYLTAAAVEREAKHSSKQSGEQSITRSADGSPVKKSSALASDEKHCRLEDTRKSGRHCQHTIDGANAIEAFFEGLQLEVSHCGIIDMIGSYLPVAITDDSTLDSDEKCTVSDSLLLLSDSDITAAIWGDCGSYDFGWHWRRRSERTQREYCLKIAATEPCAKSQLRLRILLVEVCDKFASDIEYYSHYATLQLSAASEQLQSDCETGTSQRERVFAAAISRLKLLTDASVGTVALSDSTAVPCHWQCIAGLEPTPQISFSTGKCASVAIEGDSHA